MLRTFYKADVQPVLLIEQSVQVAPWTEETFKICFQAGHQGWVIEKDNQIIAFIIVATRPEECHILNLCVERAFQHQGFGRRLLLYALEHAKRNGVGIAYLEVRRSNHIAIALYKKMGFHFVGERKAYYPAETGHEDALIFAKSIQVVLP